MSCWIEPVKQRHDNRDCRFVVRTEHAGAVVDDDVFPHPFKNFRMFGYPEPDVLLVVEAKVLAFEAADLRLDEGRKADVDRVEMGDKADRWSLRAVTPFDARRNSMLVDEDVIQANRAHLVGQQGGKCRLSG